MTGSYSIGTATGLIVATGAANALIWCCRWTHATLNALIERIRVNAVVSGTITTAVPYDLEAYVATGFTVAPTTNQIAATLTGRNAARRSDFDTTNMGGIFTLDTQAAGMTGQTFTLDAQPIARISGASGTVIGNQFFGGMVTLLEPGIKQDPLIIAANEGIAIRAPLAGPATGTFRVAISFDWRETRLRS